jgi:hypothetical protein
MASKHIILIQSLRKFNNGINELQYVMKSHLAIIAAIAMLTVSISGCIDVNQTKVLFIPENHTTIAYTNTTTYIAYNFTTKTGNPSSLQHESNTTIPIKNRTKEMRIDIKTTLLTSPEIFGNTPIKDTNLLQQFLENLSVINATLQQMMVLFPFINISINISALQNVVQNVQINQTQLIENITVTTSKEINNISRYVNITIKMPDGEIWYQHKFNESEIVNLDPIKTPMCGNWEISVDARGVGFSIDLSTYKFSYHDGYSIRIMLEEPAE